MNLSENGSTRRAIIITVTLMWLSQFCGLLAINNYTSSIFRDAGSTLHPNDCAIIVGFVQLSGSCTSTVLVDRLGRKLLLTLSAVVTSLALFSMGTYSYLQYLEIDLSSVTWIPLMALSVDVFATCVGYIPVPYIIASEILPQKVLYCEPVIAASILFV